MCGYNDTLKANSDRKKIQTLASKIQWYWGVAVPTPYNLIIHTYTQTDYFREISEGASLTKTTQVLKDLPKMLQ